MSYLIEQNPHDRLVVGRGGGGGGHGGGGHGGGGRGGHGHGRGHSRGAGGWWGPGPWWWDGYYVVDATDDEPEPKRLIHRIMGSGAPDLPNVWHDALQTKVTQRCTGAGHGKPGEDAPFAHVVAPSYAPNAKQRHTVVIHDALFRGGQPVEAFVKKTDHGCAILVQPVNMHPTSVSKCVSLYRVTVPLPSTCLPVTRVFLREDRYGLQHGQFPKITEARMT